MKGRPAPQGVNETIARLLAEGVVQEQICLQLGVGGKRIRAVMAGNMSYGGARPTWRLYRHCYECGVDKGAACRDDMDRISDVLCATRRLRTEPPEAIVDEPPAHPRKPGAVGRAEVRAPDPVVIGGRVIAFDDVDVKPTAPVHCYDDELFPFKSIAKPVQKKHCAFCRVSIVDAYGHMRTCVKTRCTRLRNAEREREAARRGVSA